MTPAGKLKLARESLGKDQKEMAKLCDIALRTWQRYEQGDRLPPGKVMLALRSMNFNTNWFFSDDPDIPMMMPVKTSAQVVDDLKETVIGDKTIAGLVDVVKVARLPPDDNLGFGAAVELLAKIFNSGNIILIRAINANLQAFSETVDSRGREAEANQRLEQLSAKMEAMEKRLADMEVMENRLADMEAVQKKITQLEAENTTLKSDIIKAQLSLKSTKREETDKPNKNRDAVQSDTLTK